MASKPAPSIMASSHDAAAGKMHHVRSQIPLAALKSHSLALQVQQPGGQRLQRILALLGGVGAGGGGDRGGGCLRNQRHRAAGSDGGGGAEGGNRPASVGGGRAAAVWICGRQRCAN